VTTRNDAATAAARAQLYQQTAKNGRVFNRTLAFYNGAPVGNSFTGNLALGVTSGGVGAALINGAGPPLGTQVPCDPPTILDLSIIYGDDNIFVIVEYSNPLPDDIFVLFSSAGQSFKPSAVSPFGDALALTFPDGNLLPDGLYSLKILRASDPTRCLAVRNGIFNISNEVACTISVTDMTSETGFPVVPPGPPGFPLGTFTISLVGTGFLSGALTLEIINQFPPFNTLLPTSIIVADDNSLQFDFMGDGTDGLYAVRVSLTDDASCFDTIGDEFGEPAIALQFA
jgi:hypothetical protein